MNRYLSYLFALFLLNNCVFANDEVQGIEECTTDAEHENCGERVPTNPLYKCENSGENACSAVPKNCEDASDISNMDGVDCTILSKTNAICISGTSGCQLIESCSEASEIQNMKNVDCTKLSKDGVICITGPSGCIMPSNCNEVISDADEDICQSFSDSVNKCDLIAADTEGEQNQKAHCKSSLRGCTESLEQADENKENTCSSRSAEGKICYYNGNDACAEASECANIELAEGKKVSQEICDRYNQDIDVNTAENKCAAEENKCVIKPFCDKGTKTTAHDCSYYALRNSEKVCDLKSESQEECEEITQDEYNQRHQQGQNPEETTACDATGSTVACESRTVDSLYNCVRKSAEGETPLVCSLTKKTCSEAESLTGINCFELTTDDILCITGASGCTEPKECDEVVSDATDAICKKFENCEFKAANSAGETNTKAHCKSISTSQGCVATLEETDGQEEICNARPKTDGAICYFDGDKSCKEATKCEDIEYAEGKSVPQAKCDTYNTDTNAQNKCVASGNKCILKPYCGQETPSQQSCSYYELKTATNVCVLKQDSTTECEEITQEQYTERQNAAVNAACQSKSGTDCALIFSNNMFINCQLEGEEGSQTCVSKGTYATCSSANALSVAANSQCNQLTHSSNTYCVKGVSGCLEVEFCEDITGEGITDSICANFPVSSHQECVKDNNDCKLKTKICSDTSIVYEGGICGKLGITLENGKCYFDGAKCAEANSCETIAETTLTGTALETLCDEFSTETKNCVADGKKCKLDDGEGKEEGKTDGKNSSKRLTLSFAILFLVLLL